MQLGEGTVASRRGISALSGNNKVMGSKSLTTMVWAMVMSSVLVVKAEPAGAFVRWCGSFPCCPNFLTTPLGSRQRDSGGFFLPRNSTTKRLETPYFSGVCGTFWGYVS
jgi:hypothetical protein